MLGPDELTFQPEAHAPARVHSASLAGAEGATSRFQAIIIFVLGTSRIGAWTDWGVCDSLAVRSYAQI